MVRAIVLALLLSSCSGSWHLRRAIKKDPALFDSTSVVKIDTLRIKTERVDTAFIQQRDTVIQYIQQDNQGRPIEIRYRWNTKTDTVEINVDCPDQEVITNTITNTNTVLVKPSIWQQIKSLWWLFVIIAGGFLLSKLIK